MARHEQHQHQHQHQQEPAPASLSPSKRRRIGSGVSAASRTATGHPPGGQPPIVASETPLSSSLSDTRHENSPRPSLRTTMGEIGFLSRSAMAESRNSSDALPTHLKLPNVVLGFLAMDGPDPSCVTISEARQLGLTAAGGHGLVLKRCATVAYLNLFLDRIAIQFPHLDRGTLVKQYDAITDKSIDVTRAYEDNALILWYFTASLAVAMGALISSHRSSLSVFVSNVRSSAVSCLNVILTSGDGVAMVHAMFMLTLLATFSHGGGSAWHLMGLTMERCVSLGFHKDPDPLERLSKVAIRERGNLFWSAYILDR